MTINEINKILAKRYLGILKNTPLSKTVIELSKMCKTILEKDMPEDKSSRWIGYIQGIMICHNLLDLEEERSFTRPLFQKFYKENKIESSTINANETEISYEVETNLSMEDFLQKLKYPDEFLLYSSAKKIIEKNGKLEFIF